MTLYVWPRRLLTPRRVYAPIGEGSVILGPRAMDGTRQASDASGGGFVRASLFDIGIRTPDQLRCLEAWNAYLDKGVVECIVPLVALYTAPRPYAGGKPQRPGTPPVAESYFDHEASLGAPMMAATADPAELRATEIVISVERGGPLLGGERFSINHGGTLGWRIYRIQRVVSTAPDADSPPNNSVHTVKIRPPLRAAIGTSEPIEFDVPRCVMRLDPERADELEPEVQGHKRATVTAHFIESF